MIPIGALSLQRRDLYRYLLMRALRQKAGRAACEMGEILE